MHYQEADHHYYSACMYVCTYPSGGVWLMMCVNVCVSEG